MVTAFYHIRSNLIRSRSAIFLLALIVFTAVFPVPFAEAGSQKIIVVKSADLKPYQDVLRGLQDDCGCDVQEVKFRDEEDRKNILNSHPDAVVAIGTAAFKKIRTITELPVVYAMVIPSEVAPPLGPNISGVSMDISPETYLSTMTALFPKAKRIGLIYNPRYTAAFVEDAVKAARALRVELVTKQLRDPSQILGALSEMQSKIDVLWMVPDPTVVASEIVEYMLRFSFQNNVPIFTFSKKYVEMGAVASLDIDPYDMGVQAASIVNRMSAGQTTGSSVYARKSHLTVNKKMATKLGLAIKDEFLAGADKVD
jgi:putative ABC transport system substrate-binding protein